MGAAARLGEAMDRELAVLDQDHLARSERLDVAEAEVLQRHALAGSTEDRPIHRVFERPDAKRIAQDDHVAHRVQEDEVVRAVELRRQPSEHLHQIGPVIAPHLVGDVVHDDFGVVVAREVVVVVGEELIAEFGEVGELAVEGEGEPFPFASVPPLEGLGIAAAGGAAGGIAGMADRRPAGEFLHDRGVLVRLVDPERLDDGADFLVGIDELVAFRVVGRHPRRELPAVLQVEQHARHLPRELVGVAGPNGRAVAAAGQVVQRRHAAFVLQLVHITARQEGERRSPVLLEI